MPKLKNIITQEEHDVILQSLARMTFFNKLMDIEYHNVLVETKLKAPTINQYIKRIKQDTAAIESHIKGLVKHLDIPFTEEYAGELYNAVVHLTCFQLSQLEEFNNGLKEIKEEAAMLINSEA